jgi:diguanylate cyclase (GGDEF)-like protein
LFAVQAATLGIVTTGALGGWGLYHWIGEAPRQQRARLEEERHHLAHMSFELLAGLPHTGQYPFVGRDNQQKLIGQDVAGLRSFRSRLDHHLAELSLSGADPQLHRELETIRLLAVQVEQNLMRAEQELRLAMQQNRHADKAVIERAMRDPGIAQIRRHGELLSQLDERLERQLHEQEQLQRRALEIGLLAWSSLLLLAWAIGLAQAWHTANHLLTPLFQLERLMQASPLEVLTRLDEPEFQRAPREIASLSRSFSALAQQVQDLLRRQSEQLNTDGLTAIGNRRHFDERLLDEWQRANRSGGILSLLLLDVDHFKLYNDRYGHVEGDRCLQRVAAAISERARRCTDVVCRIGGEEFAVLLPNTGQQEATELAQQILQAIDALAIEHSDSPVTNRVTASIGVASCRPRAQNDAATLIKQADDALYERKKRWGRHGVSVARSEAASQQQTA